MTNNQFSGLAVHHSRLNLFIVSVFPQVLCSRDAIIWLDLIWPYSFSRRVFLAVGYRGFAVFDLSIG